MNLKSEIGIVLCCYGCYLEIVSECFMTPPVIACNTHWFHKLFCSVACLHFELCTKMFLRSGTCNDGFTNWPYVASLQETLIIRIPDHHHLQITHYSKNLSWWLKIPGQKGYRALPALKKRGKIGLKISLTFLRTTSNTIEDFSNRTIQCLANLWSIPIVSSRQNLGRLSYYD